MRTNSTKAANHVKPILRIMLILGIAVQTITLTACGGGGDKNTFTDPRDGKTYKTVKIGEQVWMAENLNYEADSSKCYNDSIAYCEKYGRLYNWETAIKACPEGWHLPSNAEWDKLYRFADGDSGTESPYKSETAGKLLKAKEGWNDNEGQSGNGEDTYGFAALPGGHCFGGGCYFVDAGDGGSWWSASEWWYESDAKYAYYHEMFYTSKHAYVTHNTKESLFSVRCLQGDYKCSDNVYDPQTHYCHADGETYSCGNKPLNPETQFCKENEILGKCDGKEYNPAKQFCYNSEIFSKCGGMEYDPISEFCFKNKIYNRCGEAGGGDEYNPETHFCGTRSVGSIGVDELTELCGGKEYNIESHSCCGNAIYDTGTHSCEGGSISAKGLECNGKEYNSRTHFCFKGSLYETCGGKEYSPEEGKCDCSIADECLVVQKL